MKEPKSAPKPERADIHIDPYDFVRYMRGQGHSFATIARDVRVYFASKPNRRVTGPELRDRTTTKPRSAPAEQPDSDLHR
jgi:hypothetical protein